MYKYTEYLPPYLLKLREIRAMGESIDPEAEAVHGHMEQVYENQFVTTCDEETLRRRERLFEIYADPATEDMSFRRKRLINRYSMKLPLTMNFLLQRLDEIIGKDQYSAWVSYGDWYYRLGSWRLGPDPFRNEPYVLHIETVTDSVQWYNEVHVLVNKIKPANLVFSFSPMVAQAVTIEETVGTYPVEWNYRLGSWRMRGKPFLSSGDALADTWNYRLGSWALSRRPFGENNSMEVVKVPEVSSIQPELLAEHARLTALTISSARINGSIVIDDLQKVAEDAVTTIRYTISALTDTGDITSIELLREDGEVMSRCNVYIPAPIDGQIVIKHVIPHKEASDIG